MRLNEIKKFFSLKVRIRSEEERALIMAEGVVVEIKMAQGEGAAVIEVKMTRNKRRMNNLKRNRKRKRNRQRKRLENSMNSVAARKKTMLQVS